MSSTRFFWHSYCYFPYEKRLALMELRSLLNTNPQVKSMGLVVPGVNLDLDQLKRLTYFREITLTDGRSVVPDQAQLEFTSQGVSSKKASRNRKLTSKNRQATRYSAHGLHEYRGKFNPQIVRSIGNILSLKDNAWVLDPFCGSGTVLLECLHIGWNSVGIDLNPLAIEMSKAKLLAARISWKKIGSSFSKISKTLLHISKNVPVHRPLTPNELKRLVGSRWTERIPNLEYLLKWFTPSVLAQLYIVLEEIESLKNNEVKTIFKVALSDILRTVSLQDPGDLRMRRRKDLAENYPVISIFIDSLDSKLKMIKKARQLFHTGPTVQEAYLEDSRKSLDWIRERFRDDEFNGFDAVITSPPYATALPYIDTQRLSLCLLGLIDYKEIQSTEKQLIGNREIGQLHRTQLEEALESNTSNLPSNVFDLCHKMKKLAKLPCNGFRRRNVPALMYRYFSDIQKVMRNVSAILKGRGAFALVVGRNRTTLGGKELLIDTPRLLVDIGKSIGFEVQSFIKLDTYHRYDVHRKNSITSENLIIFGQTKKRKI